ncbi:lytic murein transglycosylase B [Accumulibacter sp.]|uniref:lytic murein transglycosylase B n=1 Tax=Accumulibacter sp. TaxID=2053492 RepID=UPI0025BC27A6|nr:lytic murein transglycosylase B [Accumulibacter sp.]
MKHLVTTLLVALLASLPPLPVFGQAAAGFSQNPEVQAFIVSMHEQHGFDVAHLTRQFAAIRPNATVLKAIRPPAVPEKQRSWDRYRERFVNEQRLVGGLSFWQKHAATLLRAEAIYGVPAEVIVAIIGVETIYGQHMGSFGVLEALASLAFLYPPRADFFRSELEQFLLLARENGVSPLEIKGSFAGAIGIPQFMPSSQRRFAVDFDGDDRIDLRHSYTDAIGSVGRFLQQHGWQKGAPVAVPARVNGNPAALLATGIKPTLTVAELASQGVAAAADGDRPAALIDLVTPGAVTEYWLGFDNFYVITRYNRSSFYAMAVFQLAEALREAHGVRVSALSANGS